MKHFLSSLLTIAVSGAMITQWVYAAAPQVVPQQTSAFPSTPVLDNFNRANGAIGNNWSGNTSGFSINANQLDVGAGDVRLWWNTAFGADQEVFVKLTNIDTAASEIDLLLKSQSATGYNNGLIEVWYEPSQQTVKVVTYASGQGWVEYGAPISVNFANGDVFGARATANGQVEVYRNGSLLGARDVSAWPHATKGGYIGLWIINGSATLLDDFGGGNLGAGGATATATAAPATATTVPTQTSVPTQTNVPATSTTAATVTSTATRTATAVPPTATHTNTSVPPTATHTHTPSATPSAGGGGAFIEQNGLLVIEAENFSEKIDRNSKSWNLRTTRTGFVGAGQMTVEPDTNLIINTVYATYSPELRYPIQLAESGVYYVWVRVWGDNNAQDSLHAGLNGQTIASADRIAFGNYRRWLWTRSTLDNASATINVASPGLHTLNIWMREDGLSIDRILLTKNANYVPSGAGPAESPRSGPTPTSTATTAPNTATSAPPTATRTATATQTPTRTATFVPPTATHTATPVNTFEPPASSLVVIPLGAGGSDVVPHQIVRASDDRLYIFTSQNGSNVIRSYRSLAAGLPSITSDFTAGPTLTETAGNPLSVEAVYDGGSIIHVLVNTTSGAIKDYVYNINTHTFSAPLTLATDGGVMNPNDLYVGTSGLSGAMDANGLLHITYWRSDNRITHRAYTYAGGALTPATNFTVVDTAGAANHPAVAVSPADNSLLVAWMSEAGGNYQILTRIRSNSGVWGSVQIASTATAWHSTAFGLNVDQGPSLVITADGTRHLLYIEHFDGTGDYGRIHYATHNGVSWTDTALANYSHDPALAVNTATGEMVILGHGHPKNGQSSSACLSMDNMCVMKRSGSGWSGMTLVTSAAGLSFDGSPSVKWSAVGFNRPGTVEALIFSIANGDYRQPTLYYVRVP